MIRPTSRAYRGVARLARLLVPLVARDRSVRRAHRGRLGAPGRLAAWAAGHRDPNRPLVWFHAASMGEGLQARAVIERLRSRRPDWQLVFTHFSASAESLAPRLPVDVADYVPYDLPGPCDSVLGALRPDALVFVKTDLWPELATRAAARGTSVLLVAATVSPVSGRGRWPVRPLAAPGYRTVVAAGAIAEADADRLAGLGVPRERIEVLGDPAFDQVVRRAEAVRADDPLLALATPDGTLVAGSTWPADEAVLLRAFRAVRHRRPEAKLVLVPHEPTASHLEALDRRIEGLGLPAATRLSAPSPGWDLLVVDRVGVLATLYGTGMAAYVGGGFGTAGLHSVLEPAAWARPVLIGPRWQSSREAGLLIEAGAATVLPAGEDRAGAALAERWVAWLADPAGCRAAGAAARAVVEAGLGAADRNAELVERLVRRDRGRVTAERAASR